MEKDSSELFTDQLQLFDQPIQILSCWVLLGPDSPCLSLSLVSRPDGHQNNLRSAAYEALMEIVKNSAKDCYPAVQKTTLVIMERLQQVLQMEVRPKPEPGAGLKSD